MSCLILKHREFINKFADIVGPITTKDFISVNAVCDKIISSKHHIKTNITLETSFGGTHKLQEKSHLNPHLGIPTNFRKNTTLATLQPRACEALYKTHTNL